MILQGMTPVLRLFVGSALVLSMVIPASGQEGRVIRLPEDARRGIVHLLSLVGPGSMATFAPEEVAGCCNSWISARIGRSLRADSIDGASSAYLDVDVRMDMAEFLKRTFHPTVPWFTTTPSSLRLTAWSKTDPPGQGFPAFGSCWIQPGLGRHPRNGNGGKHARPVYRELLSLRSFPHPGFISKRRPPGPDLPVPAGQAFWVGKKGYILGRDDDWNYFYSGEPGLTVTGRGG
jgi:hypothetical protein